MPRTYVPLIAILALWLVDIIARLVGRPDLTMNQDFKDAVTVILSTIVVYFLRRNMIKANDVDSIVDLIISKLQKKNGER